MYIPCRCMRPGPSGMARNAPATGSLAYQALAGAAVPVVAMVTKNCAASGAVSGEFLRNGRSPRPVGVAALARAQAAQEGAQSGLSLPEAVVHLPGVLFPVQAPVGRQPEGRGRAFAFRVDPGAGRQPAALLQQPAGRGQQVLVER